MSKKQIFNWLTNFYWSVNNKISLKIYTKDNQLDKRCKYYRMFCTERIK